MCKGGIGYRLEKPEGGFKTYEQGEAHKAHKPHGNTDLKAGK